MDPTQTAPISPSRVCALGWLGAALGTLGVSGLLLGAVVGMGRFVREVDWGALSTIHWLLLLPYLAFMIGFKWYFGFHRGFSLRAARRIRLLAREPTALRVALAPLFSLSLVQAPRRRVLASWGLLLGLSAVVPLVRALPQPWRGLVDLGVMIGLGLGLLSLWWHLLLPGVVDREDMAGILP